ncbi:MAG: hypothetical protein KDD82_28475 [Planctomycetes bacterium]|nr:hypothetical protein [Planctomycetota bacterium]
MSEPRFYRVSLRRLYRTSRPARWVMDAVFVGALVVTLAALHALPTVGQLINPAWQKL